MFQQDTVDGIFIKVNWVLDGNGSGNQSLVDSVVNVFWTGYSKDTVVHHNTILVYTNVESKPYITESVLAVFNKDTSFPMISGRTGTCTVMDGDNLHLG